MKNYGEIFRKLVENEGYILLSEYINAQIKVKLKCPEGHEYKVRPNDFKNKYSRCSKCSNRCPIQAKKEFIELVESMGYKLLSEYVDNSTKVNIRCNKGHEYKVIPNNFKNGSRCPKCLNVCPIQAKEQFLELLVKEGYKLISEYKNSKIKVKLKCPKGHEYKTKPNDFKNGNRCPVCTKKCPIQAKEHFIQTLDQEGYELIGEYKNTQTKVLLKCPNNHEWSVVPSNFKHQYHRCPHCKGSTGQRLLQKMLEECDIGKVIYNDREILNGLELDIYYPELSIGIEYQGNYWHTLPENIERDERKKKLCKEKGIHLIEVWDDDFLKNNDKITEEVYNKIIGLMSR